MDCTCKDCSHDKLEDCCDNDCSCCPCPPAAED